jgi:hypothetical protein
MRFSRLPDRGSLPPNFLALLRAGHDDYVINAEALAYMRERALATHRCGKRGKTRGC